MTLARPESRAAGFPQADSVLTSLHYLATTSEVRGRLCSVVSPLNRHCGADCNDHRKRDAHFTSSPLNKVTVLEQCSQCAEILAQRHNDKPLCTVDPTRRSHLPPLVSQVPVCGMHSSPVSSSGCGGISIHRRRGTTTVSHLIVIEWFVGSVVWPTPITSIPLPTTRVDTQVAAGVNSVQLA